MQEQRCNTPRSSTNSFSFVFSEKQTFVISVHGFPVPFLMICYRMTVVPGRCSSQSSVWWSSCGPCVAGPRRLLGAGPQGPTRGQLWANAGPRNHREAGGCGHDITTHRGCSKSLMPQIWGHMFGNCLQRVSISLSFWSLQDIHTYMTFRDQGSVYIAK